MCGAEGDERAPERGALLGKFDRLDRSLAENYVET
jgi:hypothetical protein